MFYITFDCMKGVNERQMQILSQLNEIGFVKVANLGKKLNVSAVTIRKDLTYLENQGMLYRTHGGASKHSLYAFERHFSEKENLYVEQKKKIASAALSFIHDNDNIVLASGTTIHYLSQLLTDFKRLTVVTPSLFVALTLCTQDSVNLIQLGGSVRKSSNSVIGSIAEEILKEFSCNTLFLGIDGIDLDFGITTSNDMEAHLNKVMIASSDKVIILTDSSKIGKRSLSKIANLDKVHTIITDASIIKSHQKQLEDFGIEVVVV